MLDEIADYINSLPLLPKEKKESEGAKAPDTAVSQPAV